MRCRAPTKADLHAVVQQPFGMQARGDTGALEHVDRALLEHAGADTAQDVFRAAPLQNERVDALPVQQLPQQQPRGSRAHDDDLRPRVTSSRNRTEAREPLERPCIGDLRVAAARGQ